MDSHPVTVALPSHLAPALSFIWYYFFFSLLWATVNWYAEFQKGHWWRKLWIYFSNIFSPRKWSWTVLIPLKVADKLMGQLLEKHTPKAVFQALATSARLHFSCCFPGTVPPPAIIFCLWKGSERSESLDSINTWMLEKCKAMSYFTGLLERGEKKLCLKTPMRTILTGCLKRQEFKLSIWMLKQNRQCNDLSCKIADIHVTAWNGKGEGEKRRNRDKMRCKGKEREVVQEEQGAVKITGLLHKK